jgi:hypothetical protein
MENILVYSLMKKTVLIISIPFYIFLSCSSHKEKLTYYENGKIKEKRTYLSSNDTLNYFCEVYYPEGNLHFKGQLINNKRVGRLFEYSIDGKIRVSTLYIEGIKNGSQYFYNEKGKLFEQDYYSNDTLTLIYNYYNDQGYLINMIRKNKPVLLGRIIYTKDAKINKDSSYYYSCQCADTMIINNEYKCNLEVFNLGRGKQYVELELLDPFNAFTLTNGKNIVSDSLQLSFSLKPKMAGDLVIEGIINVTNDTLLQGKNFPFHKEFIILNTK